MVSSSRPSPSQSRRGDEPLFSKGKTKYKPGWEEDERVAFCAQTLDGRSATAQAKETNRARGTRKLIQEFYQTQRVSQRMRRSLAANVETVRLSLKSPGVRESRQVFVEKPHPPKTWRVRHPSSSCYLESAEKGKGHGVACPLEDCGLEPNARDVQGCSVSASATGFGLSRFWTSGSCSSAAKATLSFFRSAMSEA